jgi:non-canonical purine NTP pyrophosphatase (RdgB/HAM1 family)
MNKVITMITGNEWKAQSAQHALEDFNLIIDHIKLDTPEIQDTDVRAVAEYSARFAAEKLQKPIFLTDAGLKISALNDFPGALLKFVNGWFSPSDLLKLMENKPDRTAAAIDCLAYCEPGKEPVLFYCEIPVKIAEKAEGKGSTTDQVMIWPGMDKVQGLINPDVMTKFWAENNTIYKQLGEYLAKN